MESSGDSHQTFDFTTESEEEYRCILLPSQCLSDMQAELEDDFKRMVMNIAEDINDLSMLAYMCDVSMDQTTSKGEKLTALDILRKQIRKGKFACDNVAPLETLLTDIARCDLVTKYIVPYKQKYGEHATSRSSQKSHRSSTSLSSLGSLSPAKFSISRPSSAMSLPPQAIPRTSSYPCQQRCMPLTPEESKPRAHTDPTTQCTQTTLNHNTSAVHVSACKRSLRDIILPEEESCLAGGESCQPVSHNKKTTTLSCVVAPRYSPQTSLRQTFGENSSSDWQNATEGQSILDISSTPPGDTNKSTTQKRKNRQSSTLWMDEDNIQQQLNRMHLESCSSGATALSEATEEQMSVGCDPDSMESDLEACFHHSENEFIGVNHHYPQSSFHFRPVGGAHPSYPYPHQYHHHGSNIHSINPVHCSLPTLIPSGQSPVSMHNGLPSWRRTDCVSLNNLPLNRGNGICQQAKPPRTNSMNHSWLVPRESLVNGITKLKHGKSLKDRVSFVLPVGCKAKKDPRISLSVVPCQSSHWRHVAIQGEMTIPRSCSRHKWLVEYCYCSLQVRVKVINPKNQLELGSSSMVFEIAHSEMDCNHTTSIHLSRVLEHQAFLYDKNMDKLLFHVNVQLFEHQYRQDESAVDYECKESDDFTEIISPFCVPGQMSYQNNNHQLS